MWNDSATVLTHHFRHFEMSQLKSIWSLSTFTFCTDVLAITKAFAINKFFYRGVLATINILNLELFSIYSLILAHRLNISFMYLTHELFLGYSVRDDKHHDVFTLDIWFLFIIIVIIVWRLLFMILCLRYVVFVDFCGMIRFLLYIHTSFPLLLCVAYVGKIILVGFIKPFSRINRTTITVPIIATNKTCYKQRMKEQGWKHSLQT